LNALNWKPWVLALITLLCILAPRSLSFLPFIPGIIGYLWLSLQNRAPLRVDLPLAGFFAVTILFACMSSLWAAHPDIAIDRAMNTAGIFSGGLLLLAIARNTSIKRGAGIYALIFGYIAIGFYLFADYLTFMKLSSDFLNKKVEAYNMNRLLVTYILLFIPMVLLACKTIENNARKYAVIALMFTSTLLPLWKTSSQTAQAAFLIAVGTYSIIYFIKHQGARRAVYTVSGIFLAASIICAPLIPAPLQNALQGHTQNSHIAVGANADGRLEIWNFISSKIMEKPLLGHGVEATRNMKSETQMPVNKTHAVLHPHNAYLQIWVELGVAGAALAATFALFVLYRISRVEAALQPVYFSLYASIAGTLAIGYGFWQSWQLGMIFALCAFSLLLTRFQKA
jgi:exopolysaccharide production protein ExoQ